MTFKAFIREPECIGCIRCVRVCPVHAIVGARGFVHTVLEDLCTGCGDCITACPVPCIEERSASPVPLKPAPVRPTPLRKIGGTEKERSGGQGGRQTPLGAEGVMPAQAGIHEQNPSRRRGDEEEYPQSCSVSLPPHLQQLVAAARAKSHRKYTAKGPLKTPAALRRKPR